jgi:hypothetical protein
MGRFKLIRVDSFPDMFESDKLYYSEACEVAGHLCACGCGNKTITPITSTEWTISKSINSPSLFPSIGNWQLPCRSHYWIRNGNVIWAGDWSEEQIEEGRINEENKRIAFYEDSKLDLVNKSILRKIFDWVKNWFDKN